MDLNDILDGIRVHAAAAAIAAGGTGFKDVAVGHPTPRGRSVRVYYGGEASTEHFSTGRTLNSQLVAERVLVRGFWPVSEYAPKRGRQLMFEMWRFVHEIRTRVLGDSKLGGESADLNMHFASADDVVISGVLFALIDIEFAVDYGEYALAP